MIIIKEDQGYTFFHKLLPQYQVSLKSLSLTLHKMRGEGASNHFRKAALTPDIVKLGSRSKVYLKSLGDLDLELDSIIACLHPPPTHQTFLSRITLKSLHV